MSDARCYWQVYIPDIPICWQVWPIPQTVPHVPQLASSVCRLASQPSSLFMLQLPKPASQTVMPQPTPATQTPGVFGRAQALPQVTQFEVVVRSASQPLVALPSQLPNPVLQVPMVHVDDTHGVAAALVRVGQTVSQPPQLLALLVVLISQPSVRLLTLQSAKPTLQVPVQLPPEQAATMLLVEQADPVHPPQVVAEVLMSVSQPLVCRLLSQLARPEEQVPLHTLAPQVRETMPVTEQTMPQPPQPSGSVATLRHTPEQLV